MKTYEVLEKALALIEDEKNWAQGNWGLHGGPSCAVGAIARTLGHGTIIEAGKTAAAGALEAVAPDAPEGWDDGEGGRVEFFNDKRSHAEVVALFQTAIRNEKAGAGATVQLPPDEAVVAEVIGFGADRG